MTEGVNPLARESESYYRFNGAKLETLKKVWLSPRRGFLSDEFYYMAGLGAIYSRVSSYIFADWNKCGEVMGLAPYGRPDRSSRCSRSRMASLQVPDWDGEFNQPCDRTRAGTGKQARPCSIGRTWPGAFRTMPRRFCSSARDWLRETTGAKNLCIAGGVALNCVANGKIVREAGFDNVWIQPAAGDDGIAIGCAYYGYLAIQKKPRTFVMKHAFLGARLSR